MPTKETTVEEILPAELLYQRSIPEMVLEWTEELVRYLQDDYDGQSYDPGGRYKFTIQTGRKYHKIIDHPEHGGVHAFVDKNTGQVYKPASYKAPAQHVRYDLRIIKDRERCFANADWSGGYLYLR
tara:strand:- start:90 stop:467 length:378 start_codon:yes stop_codon:yes gene_type:complete